MALLHVALQEGFSADTVTIRVEDREVFRKSGVTTRLQTGYADSVETDVADGPLTVEVEIAGKGASESIPVDAQATVYLGISATPNGGIRHKISLEPFGYV